MGVAFLQPVVCPETGCAAVSHIREVNHAAPEPARNPALRERGETMPVIIGIAAIVAMALALILRLAEGHIHAGVFLTWQTFTILGLLLWVVYDVVWWRGHRGAAA